MNQALPWWRSLVFYALKSYREFYYGKNKKHDINVL